MPLQIRGVALTKTRQTKQQQCRSPQKNKLGKIIESLTKDRRKFGVKDFKLKKPTHKVGTEYRDYRNTYLPTYIYLPTKKYGRKYPSTYKKNNFIKQKRRNHGEAIEENIKSFSSIQVALSNCQHFHSSG